MEPGTPANSEAVELANDASSAAPCPTAIDPAEFFAQSGIPCGTLAANSWLTHTNGAWTRLTGHSVEFLCSAPFIQLIHPDDRSTVAESLAAAAGNQQPTQFVCRLLQPDGSIPVLISAASTPNTGCVHMIAVAPPPTHPATPATKPSNNRRLPEFLQSSPDGTLVVDSQGTIVDTNAAADRIFNYPRCTLVGRLIDDLIPLPNSRHTEPSQRSFDSRHWTGRRTEATAHRADGHTLLVEATFHQLAPNPEADLLITLRDLSDRHRAELEIEKLAAFPRYNPEAVLELNSDGAITYYNAAALELARALSQRHPSAFLPADAAAIARGCLALGQNRLHHETEVEGRTIACSFFPVPGNGVVHCYATDITVRKLAEERLAEQAALLDHASDSILVQSLGHGVLYWNRSAEQLFGWPSGEAIGGETSQFLFKDEAQLANARRMTQARGEWNGELECHTRDGRSLLVESRWTLLRDAQSQPRAYLTLCHDITEKRRIEGQFLRAQRLESIGTLASGIAHDLNNILSPIMMSVNLLQERFTDEASARLLETLRLGVHRGADMVKQILAFTRGQEGAHTTVHLKPIVGELAKILTQTFPKNITVRTQIARDLWNIPADATQLYQVLMNLCVNARDAMPRGGLLHIEVANVAPDAGSPADDATGIPHGPSVIVRVSDTGEGIPEDVREKIWEPFYTSKPQGVGTGLGLSTVANIIKTHGGTIRADSELGRGTTFTILLPAVPETPKPTEIQQGNAMPHGRGERILVIDDERAFQEIIRAIFAKYGYRVLTASDGTEAVALFAQHRDDIDLIVTDMEMPHLDGPATINALRRLNPHVPIIAASGFSEKERQAQQLTGTEFLLKPFTTERLLTAVERHLKPKPAVNY